MVFLLKEASDLVEPFLVLHSIQNGLENSEREAELADEFGSLFWSRVWELSGLQTVSAASQEQQCELQSSKDGSFLPPEDFTYHALSYKTNATFSIKSQISLGCCWWRYQKSQQSYFKTNFKWVTWSVPSYPLHHIMSCHSCWLLRKQGKDWLKLALLLSRDKEVYLKDFEKLVPVRL